MIGLPNPYVLLGSLAAAVALSASSYIYGRHAQSVSDQVKAQSLAIEQAKTIANLEAQAHGKEIASDAEVAHVRDDYESKLQSQAAGLADANDTMRRLRDAITIYSRGASLPGAAGIPVPDPEGAGADLAALADLGREAAARADSCQARLSACEQWSQAVMRESSR
jgi:hypothetical protein